MRRQQAERSVSTQRAIMAAASDLFAEHGYERTSIDQIADRAGVSKGALYHHYRDKIEVLAAVYTDLCHEVSGRLLGVAVPGADPVEVLKAGCRLYLEVCTERTYRQIALIDAPAALGWARWRDIDAEDGGFGLLRRGLAAAASAGALPSAAIEERAHLLIAALTEAALLIARSPAPDETRATTTALIERQLEDSRTPRLRAETA
ncbi:helix-turn-helix domain-containing protein [Actinocorallia longicatena]|uniref:TetR/AcrR family transcriptional regulator n=1 Tax=Actinocorallia longicatena TaxID=111803 RepID=A0ABP6Q9T8_9ACTN